MKTQRVTVPTVLDQKLFGTPITYCDCQNNDDYCAICLASLDINRIIIDKDNCGSFSGTASQYSYKPELRKRLDELFEAAKRSTNRYFVLEGTMCRAAQSTLAGAERYMTPQTVLVEVNL